MLTVGDRVQTSEKLFPGSTDPDEIKWNGRLARIVECTDPAQDVWLIEPMDKADKADVLFAFGYELKVVVEK